MLLSIKNYIENVSDLNLREVHFTFLLQSNYDALAERAREIFAEKNSQVVGSILKDKNVNNITCLFIKSK